MIEVNYNDCKKILEENMRLIPENHKLKEEVERLNNIINELKKYIRSNEWGIDYEHSNCRTHLLDILKGSNNNE